MFDFIKITIKTFLAVLSTVLTDKNGIQKNKIYTGKGEIKMRNDPVIVVSKYSGTEAISNKVH